jgi:Arc/MetJ-type ribon-helix-helix transcriptional regulator
MKLNVNLPAEDVAFIDEYATRNGVPSRSSVVHQGISLLRMGSLENAYSEGWHEWETGADSESWESTSGDGIVDAHWWARY